MHKSWRVSDIVLVVLLVALGVLVFLQMSQSDRLYRRVDDLIKDTKELRSTQNDLQLKTQELSKKLEMIGGAAPAAGPGAEPASGPGGAPAEGIRK